MSSSSGRTALLVTAVGVLVGVPVLLGSMWQSWQLMVQTRTEHRALPLAPLKPAEGEAPAPIEAVEAPVVPASEFPMDQVVQGLREFEAPSAHGADYDPTLPYAVAWDAVEGRVTAATVDLGRDGTIDEYWTFDPLVREIVQDGVRVRHVVRDGNWVRE
jgi:hypothetical protein